MAVASLLLLCLLAFQSSEAVPVNVKPTYDNCPIGKDGIEPQNVGRRARAKILALYLKNHALCRVSLLRVFVSKDTEVQKISAKSVRR